MEPFETSLSLDLFLLRGLRREVAAWLARIDVIGEVRDDIILATHEAAANAIEHARRGSEVTLRGVRDDDKVIVVVTNSGEWKEPRSSDERRGRGLALIKRLMSDLEIQVSSHRTVVRMRKDLSLPSAST
jgi:serine/threonine-protein kinase RsbW